MAITRETRTYDPNHLASLVEDDECLCARVNGKRISTRADAFDAFEDASAVDIIDGLVVEIRWAGDH